jgi:hypothetical protein
MTMSALEFEAWWKMYSEGDDFLLLLNKHYQKIECLGSGFHHLGGYVFGDILALEGFPSQNLRTLLTKGLSSFHLKPLVSQDGPMRLELAWTIRSSVSIHSALAVLSSFVDQVLSDRVGVGQNQIVKFDFERFGICPDLTAFMASSGFWLSEEQALIPSTPPGNVMELFALTTHEAVLALRDVDELYDYCEKESIDIEGLRRVNAREVL